MKAAFFIDGANLYGATKTLGFNVDYKKLLRVFDDRDWNLIRAYYYTAIVTGEDAYSPLRPLMDWLDYNGYCVVTKDAKEYTSESGVKRIKGNMDIEMVVDMLEIAPHIDVFVLFSGDGDFCRAVDALQRQGKRVIVVSSKETNPPMVSDDLRRISDEYIDIAEIRSQIARKEGNPAPLESDTDDNPSNTASP